jgi:tetratricopeptide (TPR) repeat protein
LFRAFSVLFACGCCLSQIQTSPVESGIRAFKEGRFQEAIELLEPIALSKTGPVDAHRYLAASQLALFESQSGPNSVQGAEASSVRAFREAASDHGALTALGTSRRAVVTHDQAQELSALAEADRLNPRSLIAPAAAAVPHYSMGVAAWAKWYEPYVKARKRDGLGPDQKGPIRDRRLRNDLRAKHLSTLDDAILHLRRAIELDPEFSSAMTYLNLLIRERADLLQTEEQYLAAIAEADEWVDRAIQVQKLRANQDERS